MYIIIQIKTRYTPIRPIGHGSYGVVISAVDELTGEKVAIKKIPRAFEDPLHAKRMLREIKLMKAFSHDNVSDIDAFLTFYNRTNLPTHDFLIR